MNGPCPPAGRAARYPVSTSPLTRRTLLTLPAGLVRAATERTIEGIRLCWCPPGRFRMGSPPSEPGRRPDEAQVDVTLTRGFWMGKFEVTQAQWQQVIGPFPQPQNKGVGGDYPVHWVSYDEASAFCRELTRREPGWTFRIPTEAQWEYACRAGTTTAFCFGDTLTPKQANIAPGPLTATPCGTYPPNAWGIHDMHGNEFEWCRDWYRVSLPGGADPDLSGTRGVPNRDGTYSRVRRGGAWNDEAVWCRSAFRLRYEPNRRSDHIGFRVMAEASIP